MEAAIDEESEVQQFYRGASVFVTGGTGFMGKVLVEKLLWSCPGVDTIYLLVRNKKEKSCRERIEDLANSRCFDRVRAQDPGFSSKLVAVSGDIGEDGLGLSDQDRHRLTERVTIVFHVAATVRFEEKLSTAVKQNVRATRSVLTLCKMCPRLKAIIHVSTIYANYPVPEIGERFYDTRLDCDQLIAMVEAFSEDVLESKTKLLLGDSPNTYAFTKSLAEQVVRKHGAGLPIAIIRPAVVMCSSKEPSCGWIDNYSGATGTLLGMALGIIRIFQVDGSAFANIVPCDLAINSAIVAAWEVSEKRAISKVVPIYNFTSPLSNRITWRTCFDNFIRAGRETPSSGLQWYPSCLSIKNKYAGIVMRLLLHILPAFLMDAILRFRGKSPWMCSKYSKIHKYSDMSSNIASSFWSHEENNIPALWSLTSAKDKQLFPFDLRDFDWESFASQSFLGMRKILLKEDDDTIPAAKIKLRRLFWLHSLSMAVIIVLLCYAALSILSLIFQT